jgi:hypothetical protein
LYPRSSALVFSGPSADIVREERANKKLNCSDNEISRIKRELLWTNWVVVHWILYFKKQLSRENSSRRWQERESINGHDSGISAKRKALNLAVGRIYDFTLF